MAREVDSIPWSELGMEDTTLSVGDTVYDDLTGTPAKVVRINIGDGEHLPLVDDRGTIGIWLDNDYFGGGRHPWEVSKAWE